MYVYVVRVDTMKGDKIMSLSAAVCLLSFSCNLAQAVEVQPGVAFPLPVSSRHNHMMMCPEAFGAHTRTIQARQLARSLTSETDLEGIVMIVTSNKQIFQTHKVTVSLLTVSLPGSYYEYESECD